VANVALSSGGFVVGGSVVFSVDTGPNAGQTFTGTTDGSGNTTFTYTDTGGVGTDDVSATYTDPSGSIQKGLATVTWTSTIGAPTVKISEPANGVHFHKHQTVHVNYSCADATGGPGIQSCTGPVANHGLLDTSTSGSHVFSVTATSIDGQATTGSTTYIVNN
jgi:hypothetical protein